MGPGIVVAALAAAAAAAFAAGKNKKKGKVSPELARKFREASRRGSAQELARASREAQRRGLPGAAAALAKKARYVGKAPPPPIPGINASAWASFVKRMRGPNAIRRGAYGVFAMSVRRLADMGLMSNISRKQDRSGRPYWDGDWKAPLSKEAYMSSLRTQYRTFGKSMRQYARVYATVRRRRPSLFARAANGRPLTLSGFLALAHRTGARGALKAAASKKARFPATWAFALKRNGVF